MRGRAECERNETFRTSWTKSRGLRVAKFHDETKNMHGNHEAFLERVSQGLGFYYLLLATMNWIAALYLWRGNSRNYKLLGMDVPNYIVWLVVGGGFLIISPIAMMGSPPEFSHGIKEVIDSLSGPVTLTVGSLAGMWLLYVGRVWWTHPPIAWSLFNLSLLAMGLAMADANFFEIVGKPDNVPIVGLVFLLGFFNWLATYKAVINDERRKQGLPPVEKTEDEKVLVWPDLVYTEMICMVAMTAFMLVWALALQAPLEEPASSVKTPNPSKAPWYFLGLQEMLVYYDPWYAGVVLPSIVLVGLMAIPFLDFNKSGNGYYTIEERKFSYIVFQFGFLELWVVLIILGTFLRGPNWNFFGPFEYWDAHKVLAQNNVDLSQYFWNGLLNRSMPKAPWYFLGLQEMLVYFDPWMAGVVLPSMIIVGLMAIPYIDTNKQGNGYYTIEQRKFSYLVFQFGFLELWVTLIILGTFFRGPNWNIFGPFEYWDSHKVLALNNVDLSQYFWIKWMGQALPKPSPDDGLFWQIVTIVQREWLGILLLIVYFVALPPLMATTIFRSFFVKMGFIRFMLMSNLLLFMAALPLKMVLRWTLNLKYIVAIPEYFLNF